MPLQGSDLRSSTSNMKYTMGAPLLTGHVSVFLIYYGDFSASQTSLVETFTSNIAASSWWNIENKYYSQATNASAKVYVGDDVKFTKSVTDHYSLGKNLSGNDLPTIIQAQIKNGQLPEDLNAVYFVLTAGDVSESMPPKLGTASFCTDYCGYHVSTTLASGAKIFYAQAGVPTACMTGCGGPNASNSPNNDTGIDAMISVVAHELAEAVSDPESDGTRAWEDAEGNENADKCAVITI